uniref:SH3 domain-binding protein 5-like n=1 Tax=Timema poppense TaxID=170557 RepID=A0A7R9GW50_TIMPO|nr:unnamed protein product [Timema poppensis]
MATISQSSVSSEVIDIDKCSDEVDPRVQESRAAFRQLLCESTVRIDGLAKKLGACVEKARPYYEARMKAKEALQETQHAAVRFERANSAHAAAKEMVYLAEEGLSTEGRTFDHAWQEMLNHATMRVNESERDRTLGELEHRRTSQQYHRAEMRVQQLQKELKRAITKSSMNARRSLLQINCLAYQHQLQLLPYFEMKAQFNQLLEDQKRRVKSLEQQVGQVKTSYANALRNLEQISDEIHRTRKGETLEGQKEGESLGARRPGVGADSPQPVSTSTLTSEPNSSEAQLPHSSPSQPDTDVWSDSTGTGPPDSDYEEYLRLPDKLGPSASPTITRASRDVGDSELSEYKSLSWLSGSPRGVPQGTLCGRPMAELPVHTQDTLQPSSPRHLASRQVMETSFVNQQRPAVHSPLSPPNSDDSTYSSLIPRDDSSEQVWTEISLVDSPENPSNQTFVKMGQSARNLDRDYIQYAPLTNESGASLLPLADKAESLSFSSVIRNNPFLPIASFPDKTKTTTKTELPSSSQNTAPSDESTTRPTKPLGSGGMALFRTGSIDRASPSSSLTGWISRSSAGNGEEGALNRRQSLDALWTGPATEKVKELLSHGMMMLNISSLTERRGSEPLVEDQPDITSEVRTTSQTKKVPSPLEKSLTYLNAEDDSLSDSESLASVEMLTDDQISSLMLDQDIQDACEEVLGTPISEISPLIQDLKLLQEQQESELT